MRSLPSAGRPLRLGARTATLLVGLGRDLVAGRSSAVPATPAGYPALLAALRRITSEANVRKIAGENWLRVLEQAKGG